ncbi:4104_t:CDS:1, partial [Dentiscutata heterogama]
PKEQEKTKIRTKILYKREEKDRVAILLAHQEEKKKANLYKSRRVQL